MTTWSRILTHPSRRRQFQFDAALVDSVHRLAAAERRSPTEMAADLLNLGLREYALETDNQRCWQTLSPREQEVAALLCLNYTSDEIALRLVISPQTVKSHTRAVLHKFGVHSRKELRLLLAEWDFSAAQPHFQAWREG
jgi:DNA-binding NarL/FixJ family response regulator